MSHNAEHEHLASVTVTTAGGGSAEAHMSHIYEMINILGKRDLRMLLPLFESDPGDDEAVQDIGQRGNHFLKHTESDNDPYIKGELLAYRFNGVDEGIDMADDDQFSFGADGTAPNEPAFSVGMAIRPNAMDDRGFIARRDDTVAAEEIEYYFGTDAGSLINWVVFDDVVGARIGRTAPTLAFSEWHIVICTYDGSAAEAGLMIYVDGVRVDTGSGSAGAYTAMHNEAVVTSVGYIENAAGALDRFLDGDIALPFITARELSADDVLRLTNIYREVLHI